MAGAALLSRAGARAARAARPALRAASDWAWLARAALSPRLRADLNVEWLFILTLPNAGSTALANLLETSKHVVKLEPRGEGQWLVPAMSAPAKRWDPDYHPNYAVVRAVWLDRLARAPRRTRRRG